MKRSYKKGFIQHHLLSGKYKDKSRTINKLSKNGAGFTLIELLVVISIISLLATLAVTSLNNARKKSRDAKRLADMKQIQTALDLYYDDNFNFPLTDGDGCGGWDAGNQDYTFMTNRLTGYMDQVPVDPTAEGSNCVGYRYYRYNAGSYGCDVTKGDYYLLGVVDMETSGRPHDSSPGWSCSGRNWQNEMDWVTGKFQYN